LDIKNKVLFLYMYNKHIMSFTLVNVIVMAIVFLKHEYPESRI